MENADAQGFDTSISYSKAAYVENKKIINAAFSEKEDLLHVNFPNEQAINELALAQHYGVPTRLLDWSSEPLIALFFACYPCSALANNDYKVDSKDMSLLCLNTQKAQKTEELQLITTRRFNNPHLRAQKGLFVHMPNANSYFLNNEKWPSLEDLANLDNELQNSLHKLILQSSQADEVLRILYDYDITPHHMMPSLFNIANAQKYARMLFKNDVQK